MLYNMKHNYNTKDLIEAIKDVRASDDTPKAFIRFMNEYPKIGATYSLETGKFSVKRDIRAMINDALTERNVSKRQLAIAIEVNHSNLCSFLRGERSLPLETLEAIFCLLDL